MSVLQNLLRLKYSTKFIKYRFNKIYPDTKIIHTFCTGVNENVNNAVKDIVEYWRCRFKDEGIPEPLQSIQHILLHVLNITKCFELNQLHDERLSEAQANHLEKLCLCRLSRMPIQYIVGEWTFRDIVIKLVPPIFIPRPETEILVDFVVEQIFDRNRAKNSITNILEIGCGSGAISLAILHSCKNKANIKCTAIDRNPYACEITRGNAQKLGFDDDDITIINATIEDNGEIMLAIGQPDIDFSSKQFDVIVSNPPYIPTRNITELAPEIKMYEDIGALDGGADGLRIITSIIKYASTNLKPSGHLFMEVDSSHPKSIQFFVAKYADMKLKYECTYKDYCNSDRFVKISKMGRVCR